MKNYLIKGIVVRTEKRKVTVGFWKWKHTETVTNNFPVYEVEIYAKSIQEATNKLAKLDNRRYGLLAKEVKELP